MEHPHLVFQGSVPGNESAGCECPKHTTNGWLLILTEELPSKRTRSREVSPGRQSRLIGPLQSFGRSPPAPLRTPLGGGGEREQMLPERRKSIKMSMDANVAPRTPSSQYPMQLHHGSVNGRYGRRSVNSPAYITPLM